MTIAAIRRIDDLGRVVIPKHMREQLGICEGDALEIEIQDGKIVITKHEEEASND